MIMLFFYYKDFLEKEKFLCMIAKGDIKNYNNSKR